MIKKFINRVPGILLGVMLSASGGLLAMYSLNVVNAQTGSYVYDKPSLVAFLCNIITWMVTILFATAIIMIVLAAFQYVTAGDDTEKTSKARRTLTYSAIGIAVALIAYGFPAIVASIIPGNPSVSAFNCSVSSGSSSSGGGGLPAASRA